jgi:hypothetical protein
MIAEAERLKARLLGMVDGYLVLAEETTQKDQNNEFEDFSEVLDEYTVAVVDAAKHGAA